MANPRCFTTTLSGDIPNPYLRFDVAWHYFGSLAKKGGADWAAGKITAEEGVEALMGALNTGTSEKDKWPALRNLLLKQRDINAMVAHLLVAVRLAGYNNIEKVTDWFQGFCRAFVAMEIKKTEDTIAQSQMNIASLQAKIV